jgi:molybdopterin-guanine dinucleotide biosynthesis protein A
MTYDAIVLCGGGARRMDGADKAEVVVAGRRLLDRTLGALEGASKIVAVGPKRDSSAEVAWTSEQPPGGGPVAGIAAGLELVDAELVVITGVDHPFLQQDLVDRLADSVGDRDGAIVRDASGRHQFLVGVYRTEILRARLSDRDPRGMAVKELIEDLDLGFLDDPRAAIDVDTWRDVVAAEKEDA